MVPRYVFSPFRGLFLFEGGFDVNNYVPVLVEQDGENKLWYMNITNMSYSELIAIRNELIGCHDVSIRYLDSIFAQSIRHNNTYYRECKKICKREKEKIKRKQIKSENRRRDRKNDKY